MKPEPQWLGLFKQNLAKTMKPQPEWLELFKRNLAKKVKPIQNPKPILIYNGVSVINDHQSPYQKDHNYSYLNWQNDLALDLGQNGYGLDRLLGTLNLNSEIVIDNKELANHEAHYHTAILDAVADYVNHDLFKAIDHPENEVLNLQHLQIEDVLNVDFAQALPELQCVVFLDDQGNGFAALPLYDTQETLTHCPKVTVTVSELQNYLQQFNLTEINNFYLLHLKCHYSRCYLDNVSLNSYLGEPHNEIQPHLRNNIVDQDFGLLKTAWNGPQGNYHALIEEYLTKHLKTEIDSDAIHLSLPDADQELQDFLACFHELNIITLYECRGEYSFSNFALKLNGNWALTSLLTAISHKTIELWLQKDLSNSFGVMQTKAVKLQQAKTIKPLVKNNGLNQIIATLQDNNEHQYYFKNNYLKTFWNQENKQVDVDKVKLWQEEP